MSVNEMTTHPTLLNPNEPLTDNQLRHALGEFAPACEKCRREGGWKYSTFRNMARELLALRAARRAAEGLAETMIGLGRFATEMCEDVGVSPHVASIKRAKAAHDAYRLATRTDGQVTK